MAESTVGRKLRKAGTQTHRAGAKRAPVTDSEIIRLRMKGRLWREIATEVGDDEERCTRTVAEDEDQRPDLNSWRTNGD